MCITAKALALFLSLLPAEIVTTEPERITVAATAGDAVWIETEDLWCTDSPQKGRDSED